MKHMHSASIFDSNLTPNNAVFKGYIYIDDVILDKNMPTSNEYINIIQENGFKLGIPSRNEYGNFGLYVPESAFNKNP
jgi:aspartate 1-decarboxylase